MSRITIDTGLECEAADGSLISLPEIAVVETKTLGPPCAIDHFLWSHHRRPVKISKFCTGLAALTPRLPANKWNRVLRTYFDWTPEPAHPDCRQPRAVATHIGAQTVAESTARLGHQSTTPPNANEGSRT